MKYAVEYFIGPGAEHREQEFFDAAELSLAKGLVGKVVVDKRSHKWFDVIKQQTRVKHVWETDD